MQKEHRKLQNSFPTAHSATHAMWFQNFCSCHFILPNPDQSRHFKWRDGCGHIFLSFCVGCFFLCFKSHPFLSLAQPLCSNSLPHKSCNKHFQTRAKLREQKRGRDCRVSWVCFSKSVCFFSKEWTKRNNQLSTPSHLKIDHQLSSWNYDPLSAVAVQLTPWAYRRSVWFEGAEYFLSKMTKTGRYIDAPLGEQKRFFFLLRENPLKMNDRYTCTHKRKTCDDLWFASKWKMLQCIQKTNFAQWPKGKSPLCSLKQDHNSQWLHLFRNPVY